MIGVRQGDVHALQVRGDLLRSYHDVFTPEAMAALAALAPLNAPRKALMAARTERRARRARDRRGIAFLDAASTIPGTDISVQDARDGKFSGGGIPSDLRRQWIQGTGPATKPNAPVEQGLRNVAYALLSGADGWMFDGEDALGQISTMSLDNQRNLKLAIARDPVFLEVVEHVAAEMNKWARGFFGREIIDDWREQLDFTTKIWRARGLHLDDRHVRLADGTGFSASIVDTVLYVVNNHERLKESFTCRRSRPPPRPHSGIEY
jgi:malate synthase